MQCPVKAAQGKARLVNMLSVEGIDIPILTYTLKHLFSYDRSWKMIAEELREANLDQGSDLPLGSESC
jgi:hypothetical protein